MSNLMVVKKNAANGKIMTVFDFMVAKRDLIAKALPNSITPDRLIGVFTMILKNSPALSQCSQSSLVAAVIQTVQLGLTPGNIGHVYLVPFNNRQKDGSFRKEVQLIVGYRGMCELVNRSGQAVVLTAEVVKEKDEFEYELGLNPRLRHVPATGDRGQTVGVYAIAKSMAAGEKIFVYLQSAEIEKVKHASKAGASEFSPWNTWPDEMAKKTAVKRLCKLLPLSVDTQKQLSADETIKTRIDTDMATLPDDTHWEGANGAEEAELADANHPPNAMQSSGNGSNLNNQPQNDRIPSPDAISCITVPQQKRLYAIAGKAGIKDVKEWLRYTFSIDSVDKISKPDYEKICLAAEGYKLL